MIYGFIKENNDYISKDKQKRAIEQFAKTKELPIDRYIIDNYKKSYCEIYNLKRGVCTGSYIFSLKANDILICSHFYVLAYSYKTVVFLIKTALEQGAKVYSVEGDIELNESHLKTLSIIYEVQCFFNHRREEKTLFSNWKYKLDPFKSEIEALIRKGLPIVQIAKNFHVSPITVRKFLDKEPELSAVYKETNPCFGRIKKTKWLEKRPFLKTQINRYIRKVQANIVPTKNLLLAEELKGENKK